MRPFPIARVRREFPALAQSHNGRPRVFMDNPAGTQLPRRVIDAVSNAMVGAASNYGGFFENSRNAEAIHARAHGAMADFVNARSPDEIVVAVVPSCEAIRRPANGEGAAETAAPADLLTVRTG